MKDVPLKKSIKQICGRLYYVINGERKHIEHTDLELKAIPESIEGSIK